MIRPVYKLEIINGRVRLMEWDTWEDEGGHLKSNWCFVCDSYVDTSQVQGVIDEARRLAEEMYEEMTRVKGLRDWIEEPYKLPIEQRFKIPWKKEGGEG